MPSEPLTDAAVYLMREATICPRCNVKHWPQPASVVIHDPDDEAVACGAFHLERMSKRHIWLTVYAADGRSLVVNLHAKGRITMRMEETSHGS